MTEADSSSSNPLRSALCRVCLLEQYLIECATRQQQTPKLRSHSTASRLIARILGMLHQHTSRIVALLETIPGGIAEFRRTTGSSAGDFVTLIDRDGARNRAAMLQDNYALLNLAAMHYTALHASALGLSEPSIGGLALVHLKEITPLIREISEIMPAIALDELGQEFGGLDPAAGEVALHNTQEAWHVDAPGSGGGR